MDIVLNAVFGSLLWHEAHCVDITGGGELAHWGPLVSLGIIDQHRQPLAIVVISSCNDGSLIVQTIDD